MLKGRSLMNIYQLAEEGLGYRETARLTGHLQEYRQKVLTRWRKVWKHQP